MMAFGEMNLTEKANYDNTRNSHVAKEIAALESVIFYDLALSLGTGNAPTPSCSPSEALALSKKYGVDL